jgi:hypothetical protein
VPTIAVAVGTLRFAHPTFSARSNDAFEDGYVGASPRLTVTLCRDYSAACCATVGVVPATVARRMSRGCD